MSAGTFYITTAIDYANDLPHVGTAYEKVCADVIARFKRLMGCDVRFQMGNDEHSINVRREAIKAGLDTATYCERMGEAFEQAWRALDISYDVFLRTSEERHQRAVQRLFMEIYDSGDIYKGTYDGWYCESCEAFLRDSDLVDGKCPTHMREPSWIKEENYFFALSKYEGRLRQHIEAHPEFIRPESRRNEILSLIDRGLEDISVSRSSFDWGIPVPVDSTHVVYVWVDALINYISGLGYGDDGALLDPYWPADLHLIGKDITRFHCAVWPAMLMSADMALPKTVFGHGFVSLEGRKMSKSSGHVVPPQEVVDQFGADALRYFLMREVSFGQDGDFSWERFYERYNADLANDLGNLVSRTATMVHRYSDGMVPSISDASYGQPLRDKALEIVGRVRRAVDDLALNAAFDAIWELVREANRFVETKAPWELAKVPSKAGELGAVLYSLLETIRYLAVLLSPAMPAKCEEIWSLLGQKGHASDPRWGELEHWGALRAGTSIRKGAPLFPRTDRTRRAGAGDRKPSVEVEKPRTESRASSRGEALAPIDIEEFRRVDLRVARIEAAERIKGADKLLRLTVNLGEDRRQLVVGVAEHYTPEELIGRRIVVVANLKPATIRGIRSEGMLLAAQEEGTLRLVMVDGEIGVGAKVS